MEGVWVAGRGMGGSVLRLIRDGTADCFMAVDGDRFYICRRLVAYGKLNNQLGDPNEAVEE